MPTPMTDEELETQKGTATEIDDFYYKHEDDEDNYFSAVLYKTPDDRHFRVVESSGYNSQFCAAGNIGEWLTDDEIDTWTDY